MSQNRTVQLIFQSVYVAFGVLAVFASVGLFNASPYTSFYVKFTNLSNYFCLAVMVAELVQTAGRTADGRVTRWPLAKFLGVLAILLTFLVFNIMLMPAQSLEKSLKVESILCHQVLPVMFVLDWALFYRHGDIKASWPVISAAVVLLYVAFVYLRAALLGFAGDDLYPYFFLNLDTQGVFGVVGWVSVLAAAFVAVGYGFLALDHRASRMA